MSADRPVTAPASLLRDASVEELREAAVIMGDGGHAHQLAAEALRLVAELRESGKMSAAANALRMAGDQLVRDWEGADEIIPAAQEYSDAAALLHSLAGTR